LNLGTPIDFSSLWHPKSSHGKVVGAKKLTKIEEKHLINAYFSSTTNAQVVEIS